MHFNFKGLNQNKYDQLDLIILNLNVDSVCCMEHSCNDN